MTGTLLTMPVRRPKTDPAIEALIPGGLNPPEDIPPEIFHAAMRIHLTPARLDMKALAEELGIARRSLYRKVEDREKLLGEVVWYLVRTLLALSLRLPDTLIGRQRILEFARRFMLSLQRQPAYWRFIREEPSAALRVLTRVDGPVQPRQVELIDRLLEREEMRGALAFTVPRRNVAYTIVRVAESFLYGDVVANVEPDIDRAVDVIDVILQGAEIAASATPSQRAQHSG